MALPARRGGPGSNGRPAGSDPQRSSRPLSPDPVTFELPWPPSVNHSYRPEWNADEARMVTKLKRTAKTFRETAIWTMIAQRVPRTRVALPLRISIVAIQPALGRTCDLDNLLKPTLDAIKKHGLIADDSYVDDLRITRGPRDGRGRLVVTVSMLQGG